MIEKFVGNFHIDKLLVRFVSHQAAEEALESKSGEE